MNLKIVVFYFVGEIFSVASVGVALFWSAGRLDWWPAWAVMAVLLSWLTALGIVILRSNPDLLIERIHPPKGSKTWDTNINLILRLVTLSRYIIAGLDQRFGWTGDFPFAVQITALIVCALGYALFVWAAASNPFFSQIVRIQTERGHSVVTKGPYQVVRHPSYVGGILFELAVPFLFASWWALIPSVIGALLLILRTALEDRTLKSELSGYSDYIRHVHYRLLPGIW
jgi:protein-S-isoprenylcysteine O-methyltransferase Ste14